MFSYISGFQTVLIEAKPFKGTRGNFLFGRIFVLGSP